METKTPSSFKIILLGQLMVNFPFCIITTLVFIVCLNMDLGLTFTIVVSSGVGWYFWGVFLNKWKQWALDRGVDKERLFQLSKRGLINFYRYRIYD